MQQATVVISMLTSAVTATTGWDFFAMETLIL